MNRQITSAEEQLIRWMLEHGNPRRELFSHSLKGRRLLPTVAAAVARALIFQSTVFLSHQADFIFWRILSLAMITI